MHDHCRKCRKDKQTKKYISQPAKLTYSLYNYSGVRLSSQTFVFFYFQWSFQSANKFLFFSILPLFQSSMASCHSLTVFLTLQLKAIVHKLTGLWTVAPECSKLNQHVFGKGILLLSRAQGTWDLDAQGSPDLGLVSHAPSEGYTESRHQTLSNQKQRSET